MLPLLKKVRRLEREKGLGPSEARDLAMLLRWMKAQVDFFMVSA